MTEYYHTKQITANTSERKMIGFFRANQC